jgi:outer membrane biosynthesis protein TonB
MKKVVLTSVFALVFGCLVSYAAPAPRGGKAPEKPKTEKIDKKGGDKNHVAHKPAPKPNHKPVAHKPEPKPNKHVAHKPAPKPNHKQVCHVKHHHKPECHKPHHKVVLDPLGIRALTTAAIVAAIID